MSKLSPDEFFVSSAEWLDRFRRVHPRATYRDHDPKFGPVYVRGQGARVWDADGNDYFDLTCGYSTTNFGHAFQPLIQAAREQLGKLTHLTGEPHCDRILLAERLVELFGQQTSHTKVVFNVNGSRAVESAWKAAVAFRPGKLLTLGPCFHGRSLATLGLGSDGNYGFEMLNPESHIHWNGNHYPYCGDCALNLQYPDCGLKCVEGLFDFLATKGHLISAVLVEPAIGARGYIVPPPEFFQRLQQVTQSAGILTIADEIQTGLGRFGNWLLSTQQGWQADLVVLGKALSGGIAPISAVVGRADVLECLPAGSESETFAGSPLSCAVGLEVLEQLEVGPWMENGKLVGQALRKFMTEQFATFKRNLRVTVEGIAACCVLEFAAKHNQNDRPTQNGRELARTMATSCLRHGLLVHWSGPTGSRIVMLPPLTTSLAELREMQERLGKAIVGMSLEIAMPADERSVFKDAREP